MKKTITLLVLIVCFQTLKAQFVTIPDANFVTWLQANIPSAMAGNQMDITNPNITNRTFIDITWQNIYDITGIQYFTSLQKLNCSRNQISNLSFLPNSLDTLFCGQNITTNLNGLPSGLKYLDCWLGNIGDLGPLPVSLEYINASNNNINVVSILPPNLKHFDISDNNFIVPNLISGFALPNTLLIFNCTSSNLTSLPILPSGLKELSCVNNQITILPTLPSSLTILACTYNQLSSLPTLPNSLAYLDCEGNQLSNLPVLPNSLIYLECRNNQITSLPQLPPNLNYFVCNTNLITCFPTFPNSINNVFDIRYNPYSCLPNYVQGMSSEDLNYPLCVSGNTTTNTNNCTTTRGITGYAYLDANLNCIKNSTESGISNGIVKLYDNSNTFLASTNIYGNGFYYFDVPTGNYRVVIDTLNYPFTARCNGIDSLVTLNALQSAADSIDFSVVCKPGFDVGIQSVSTYGLPFPGLTHTLTVASGDMIHWYNFNCASGVAGTVSFSVNGPVTYVGPAAGALTPIVTGNIYTYNISNFGTINNSTDFSLVFQTNTTAQAGNVICVSATITPISGDNNTSNNIYQYCYQVVNSFDPNIKEVYPIEVAPNFTDWLTYTIHFQNTGNAAAINIRLEDEFDIKLDPETFEVINYSHYNVIDLTGKHLTVRFPNIQLADSTSNPQGSIGFVQYRIKPKANWIADTIKNNASIYFDYNAPIVTNTVKTHFMTATGIPGMSYLNEVGISPNPSNDIVAITSRFDFDKIELLNITGQIIVSETVHSKTQQLHLQNFAEGIYFVKVSYANGQTVTKKVIKN